MQWRSHGEPITLYSNLKEKNTIKTPTLKSNSPTPSKPKLTKSGKVGGLTQPKFNASKTSAQWGRASVRKKAAPQAPLGAPAIFYALETSESRDQITSHGKKCMSSSYTVHRAYLWKRGKYAQLIFEKVSTLYSQDRMIISQWINKQINEAKQNSEIVIHLYQMISHRKLKFSKMWRKLHSDTFIILYMK